MDEQVVRVAIPVPVRSLFDYLAPAGAAFPGCRVEVPFGRRRLVGVVLALQQVAAVDPERLRPIYGVLDAVPLLSPPLRRLLHWAATYYHHPEGEVVIGALPPALRQARALPTARRVFSKTAMAPSRTPGRGPIAAACWERLGASALPEVELQNPRARAWLERWLVEGWVEAQSQPLLALPAAAVPGAALNSAQAAAAAAIMATLGSNQPFLLHGVTGSGKTEVYLEVIAATLARGHQALLLVPEIGLTPQLLRRLARLGARVALFHSGLTEAERTLSWTAACQGEADVVVGTRSAVFAALPRLGLIVVDEEHDQSYKQQEGFRYQARDLAVLRAQFEGVPVVLGSATPAFESLRNALEGRYRLLSLPERVARRSLPRIQVLDLRRTPAPDGLAPALVQRLQSVHAAGAQSLLFLNRRGYAPALICRACSWVAVCSRCDARLVWHQQAAMLRCHHCGLAQPKPGSCPACAGPGLAPAGVGTERVEAALQRYFPTATIARLDADTTRRKGSLQQRLEEAARADFLVGTQMLAKGHDFPGIALVAVLGLDGALASADFRGPEHAAQLLLQVAGRAGRGDQGGEVWVQSMRPDDLLFAALRDQDYLRFAETGLKERAAAGFPPFGHLALVEAESRQAGRALQFLTALRAQGLALGVEGVVFYDPVPAILERKAGYFRARLLLSATRRSPLHALLDAWLPLLEAAGRQVRWRLDVDPQTSDS